MDEPAMSIHITLKQLEVFATVIKESSYTQAAKTLNMTQPAVSTQIKNLEGQLGIKLFDYVSKKLTLTHAGRDVYKKIHEVQNKVDELKNFIFNIKGLLTGNLHIAIPQGAQKYIFHLIKEFYDLHPQVEIDIQVTGPNSHLDLLKNDDIDFSLTENPIKNLSLYSEVLFTYNSYLIAPTNHPLSKKKKIPLASIGNETFIINKHRTHSQKILEDEIIKKQSKLIHVDNIESMKYAVEAGIGLAMVSDNALSLESNKKYYAILDVEGLPIQSRVHLTHRHKKLLSPLGAEFKKFARAYCKNHFS